MEGVGVGFSVEVGVGVASGRGFSGGAEVSGSSRGGVMGRLGGATGAVNSSPEGASDFLRDAS